MGETAGKQRRADGAFWKADPVPSCAGIPGAVQVELATVAAEAQGSEASKQREVEDGSFSMLLRSSPLAWELWVLCGSCSEPWPSFSCG